MCVVNGLNFDRDDVEKIKSENKSLSAKIEGLQNQLLVKIYFHISNKKKTK